MLPSSIVRLRPNGPWRFGPDSGARERVDYHLHSDAVYSAVTSAMAQLGILEDWLKDTAQNEPMRPAVLFSSLYPFQKDTLFVIPPRSVWPPQASMKLRYKGARFAPFSVVETLLNEKAIEEDRWQVDGDSACLIPSGWQSGPFRTAMRSSAGVDRLDEGRINVHVTACLEFTRDSGLWLIVAFADEAAKSKWEPPVRSAFRLLADSGMGGERSRGWGRSSEPRWDKPDALALKTEPEPAESAYWLLSVYGPAESDSVDWSRGNYSSITRSGRIESAGRWGERKAPTAMVAEGSVLVATQEPRGTVRDIAPEGFPHPVYRAGYALTIPIPWRVPA